MTYKEQYPEFLEETMFAEQGTKVLITDRESDKYLEEYRLRELKKKYPQWDDRNR